MSTLYEALIHDFLNILLISPLQRPEVKKLHKNVLAMYRRGSQTQKRLRSVRSPLSFPVRLSFGMTNSPFSVNFV